MRGVAGPIHDVKQPSDFARRRASTDWLPAEPPDLIRGEGGQPTLRPSRRSLAASPRDRFEPGFASITFAPVRERSAARALVRNAAPVACLSPPRLRGGKGHAGTPCEGVPAPQ